MASLSSSGEIEPYWFGLGAIALICVVAQPRFNRFESNDDADVEFVVVVGGWWRLACEAWVGKS